jgi:hypothetical protein
MEWVEVEGTLEDGISSGCLTCPLPVRILEVSDRQSERPLARGIIRRWHRLQEGPGMGCLLRVEDREPGGGTWEKGITNKYLIINLVNNDSLLHKSS